MSDIMLINHLGNINAISKGIYEITGLKFNDLLNHKINITDIFPKCKDMIEQISELLTLSFDPSYIYKYFRLFEFEFKDDFQFQHPVL